jgi:hypothetical protein
MKLLRISQFFSSSFLLLLTVSYLSADIKLSEKEQLALQAQTQWALNLIRSNHYLKNEIQTINGSQIIENFADNLDYSKLYFLRSDIDDYLFRFSDSMEGFL